MRMSFHYFTTKALCVRAGFSTAEAQVIAYACQYVDDAQEHEEIRILGLPEPFYERMGRDSLDPTCTAHKGIENILYNFDGVRRKVLLPFHFMPTGWNAAHTKFNYLAKAESPPARDLVRLALQKLRSTPPESEFRELELIRLGIALHTYEDTFAHQNFSARNNRMENGASEILIRVNKRVRHLQAIFYLTGFLGYSIGHGLLGTFPDRFNTRISYLNGRNKEVSINTTPRFRVACKRVYYLLREYTLAPDNWKEEWKRLRNCLKWDQSRKTDIKKTFSAHYPEIDFSYTASAWKRQALKLYVPGSYVFKGDMKWLNFHRASWDQRQYVLSFLP
ncbi:MAG: DUF6765 family protein [Candidatus Syntrophosphaera sp.]